MNFLLIRYQARFRRASAGKASKSRSVKTSGNYQSVEEICHTIVYSHEGKNIRFGDVAKVYPSFAPEKYPRRIIVVRPYTEIGLEWT
ncbi:MAG: hypothetical protein JNL51_11340 [Chitinophagaceae bacterium]|nr:hypothetical protein [Chitinophagaceae bacterium]